jgi:hypothetical protein
VNICFTKLCRELHSLIMKSRRGSIASPRHVARGNCKIERPVKEPDPVRLISSTQPQHHIIPVLNITLVTLSSVLERRVGGYSLVIEHLEDCHDCISKTTDLWLRIDPIEKIENEIFRFERRICCGVENVLGC